MNPENMNIPCCLRFYILTIIVMLQLSVQSVSSAEPDSVSVAVPSIKDISIINDNKALYVNFVLKNSFSPQVSHALRSGIPITFIFDIMLESPGTFLDTTVVSSTVKRKIKYDTIKDEYMVSFDPHSPRVIMVNTASEAIKLVSRLDHISLVSLNRLIKGSVYRLRVRAEVEKKQSTIAFTGIVSIFSSWCFKTRWYEVIFNY